MPKKKKFYCHPRRAYEKRISLGFTQAQIAEIIGTSNIRISKWENGASPVPQYLIVIYDLLSRLRNPKDYRAPSGK